MGRYLGKESDGGEIGDTSWKGDLFISCGGRGASGFLEWRMLRGVFVCALCVMGF